jgi:hypothetical protein
MLCWCFRSSRSQKSDALAHEDITYWNSVLKDGDTPFDATEARGHLASIGRRRAGQHLHQYQHDISAETLRGMDELGFQVLGARNVPSDIIEEKVNPVLSLADRTSTGYDIKEAVGRIRPLKSRLFALISLPIGPFVNPDKGAERHLGLIGGQNA